MERTLSLSLTKMELLPLLWSTLAILNYSLLTGRHLHFPLQTALRLLGH